MDFINFKCRSKYSSTECVGWVFGIFSLFSFLMMKLMLNKQLFPSNNNFEFEEKILKLIQVMVNMKQQKLSIAIAPECLNSSQHVENLSLFFVLFQFSVLMLVFGIFLRFSPSLMCLYLSIVCDYIIISNAVIALSLQFSHLLRSWLIFSFSFCLRKAALVSELNLQILHTTQKSLQVSGFHSL